MTTLRQDGRVCLLCRPLSADLFKPADAEPIGLCPKHAAADEMLEALRVVDAEMRRDNVCHSNVAVALVRAAIAKASGEG